MAANLSPSKKRKQLVLDLVATLIVLLLALLVVLPIWWIFRSSLMSTAKLNEYPPSFIPHEWLWANYSKALETFEYWRYFHHHSGRYFWYGDRNFLWLCFCKTSFPWQEADL